ncbi:MAG: hypothetical protein HY817_00290 [Candidatus Abawacabacteria bacterium]|nr:hypothetical protein [Candidatus Abawacabacteria bacterium]
MLSPLTLSTKILFLLITLLIAVISFQAGFHKGHNQVNCDPFRLIRDPARTPYPNIQSLLKNPQ